MRELIVVVLVAAGYAGWRLYRLCISAGTGMPEKKLFTLSRMDWTTAWYNEDHERWGKYPWYELTLQSRKDGFVDGQYE